MGKVEPPISIMSAHNKSPHTTTSASKGSGSKSQSIRRFDQGKRSFWWRRLSDVDPISLEPIKRLRYEPFALGSDETHLNYFDGKLLAEFLVTANSFFHPLSRRELTLQECEQLDNYLHDNRLKRMDVAKAFNQRNESGSSVQERADLAESLLHNFHEASRFRSESYRSRSERFRSEVAREEQVGDEHTSSDSEGAVSSDEFVLPTDFPSLAGDASVQSVASSRVIGSWTQYTTIASRNDAFPNLDGTTFDAPAPVAQPQWGRPRYQSRPKPEVEHTQ